MPKSRKRPKKAKPDQHAQFAETARRLGADMSEETFKRAIGEIARGRSRRDDEKSDKK
jgi:hypothetical protein